MKICEKSEIYQAFQTLSEKSSSGASLHLIRKIFLAFFTLFISRMCAYGLRLRLHISIRKDDCLNANRFRKFNHPLNKIFLKIMLLLFAHIYLREKKNMIYQAVSPQRERRFIVLSHFFLPFQFSRNDGKKKFNNKKKTQKYMRVSETTNGDGEKVREKIINSFHGTIFPSFCSFSTVEENFMFHILIIYCTLLFWFCPFAAQ